MLCYHNVVLGSGVALKFQAETELLADLFFYGSYLVIGKTVGDEYSSIMPLRKPLQPQQLSAQAASISVLFAHLVTNAWLTLFLIRNVLPWFCLVLLCLSC